MRLTINRKTVTVKSHPLTRLLDVLREECGLTGTKEGCGEGECGACTVLVDGEAVNSCLVPVAQVQGSRVTTIEGLGGNHALQRAFVEHGGAQCGICTPGMIMAAAALGARPSLDEIRIGLAGNLCRCTGYAAIYRSVLASRAGAKVRLRAKRVGEVSPGPARTRAARDSGVLSRRAATRRRRKRSKGQRAKA
jgi:aerobic-type carbon monoxide dehydrogenase small subunit (CoxS/CutS family)